MLTTVPSSSSTPEPRVTVARVIRPRTERSSRSGAPGSSAIPRSDPPGGTVDLARQLLRRVGSGPTRLQPAVDLLAFGMAHQTDHVTGSGHGDKRLERLELGGVRRDVGHPDALGPGTQQGLELLHGATSQVVLLVADRHHVRVT